MIYTLNLSLSLPKRACLYLLLVLLYRVMLLQAVFVLPVDPLAEVIASSPAIRDRPRADLPHCIQYPAGYRKS